MPTAAHVQALIDACHADLDRLDTLTTPAIPGPRLSDLARQDPDPFYAVAQAAITRRTTTR